MAGSLQLKRSFLYTTMTKKMKYTLLIAAAGVITSVLGCSWWRHFVHSKQHPLLPPGSTAPDFTAQDQEGYTVQLTDFKGKKKLILYFYPKDNSPFCTLQAKSLRDHYQELRKAGFEVLGVSTDSAASHQAFRKKYDLPFALLTDNTKSLQRKYGAWVRRPALGWGTARVTFVIDEQGVIVDVIQKVKVRNHAEQILRHAAKAGVTHEL